MAADRERRAAVENDSDLPWREVGTRTRQTASVR